MLKFILILIAISGVFTLDVYLPGIPDATQSLSATIAQLNFTFTLFSIVFACGQLVWGPLSDKFGRKPILLFGLTLASCATIACAFSVEYWQLLCLRGLQAIGASCFVVLNAIVRDLYDGGVATRWRAHLAAVSGLSISIAPSIGALSVSALGWRGTFIASSIVLIVTLVMIKCFYLETGTRNHTSNTQQILKNYLSLLTNNIDYLMHTLQGAFAYSVHFCFVILSPYLIIDIIGLDLEHYSLVMFIYGLSWLASGSITAFLSKFFSNKKIVSTGNYIMLFGAVMLLGQSVFIIKLNIFELMVPVLIMVLGAIIIRPTCITMAL